MPAQLNIFLLLFGGLQGLLLSLFLVRKGSLRNSYIFLLLYFAVMLLQITLKVMSKGWLIENWATLYWISYSLPLLYGPLIFLFTRQILLNRRFTGSDIFHFIPFLFMISGTWVHEMDLLPRSWEIVLYGKKTELILQLTSLVVYHGWSLQYWRRYQNMLKDNFSETARIRANWIRQFIVASLVACAAVSVAIYLLYMNYPRGFGYRYAFVVLTIFIYWISYTALTKPSVFSVVQDGTANTNRLVLSFPKLVVHRPAKKYSNSGLSSQEKATIRLAIDKSMMEDRVYLDPGLTINDLAAGIKCNRHHLSQVLNEDMQQSFYDYVNRYRVEEAKQLLCDPSRAGHKIASIAFDAGFNSLSTFNDVFRKVTGQTPSQYRKQEKETKQQRV